VVKTSNVRTPAEREPSAARNIYAFGITSFLNDTATEMAYWVLPAFLASLGAGPAQLGLIEGVAESVASFAKLFSGYLTDHIHRRKPVVVAGYFVANAVKPLLAIVTAWPQILLIRFTDRLAKGVRGAPRDVMVAESVPKESAGLSLRTDPVDGFCRGHCRASGRAGPAFALRNSQRVLGGCNSGSIVRAGRAAGDTRNEAGLRGGQPRRLQEKTPTPASPSASRAERITKLANVFLLRSRRRDAFFSGQLERHVSGSAGAECWDPRGARAAARPGLQHYLHACILARGMVQRSRFAPAGGSVGYVIFAAVYFVFGRAPSTLAIWIAMAVYGFYYALTQPVLKALVVETVGERCAAALWAFIFL
jgi:hypothetical protein